MNELGEDICGEGEGESGEVLVRVSAEYPELVQHAPSVWRSPGPCGDAAGRRMEVRERGWHRHHRGDSSPPQPSCMHDLGRDQHRRQHGGVEDFSYSIAIHMPIIYIYIGYPLSFAVSDWQLHVCKPAPGSVGPPFTYYPVA